MNSAALVAVIAALAAPIGAYLVAARRFSGEIDTSDAKDLWREAADLRKWSTERIETLNGIVERLEDRVRSLEGENRELREGRLNV